MIKKAFQSRDADSVDSALRTLATERQGLAAIEAALARELGDSFRAAVELIGGISGRVILTGVGKSGHICAKLAATFASTGTPAYFVHAAEANHGDLGMIASGDVVLALSKGGESAELKSIIAYTRRFSIPLIAMTGSPQSALGSAADLVLLLPAAEEACPHGLAPTTSTLMQLALGDALALALLEARGFTPNDFHVFHPGGKLGASLTHVREIMHTGERIPLVSLGTSIQQAVQVLSDKKFGCVGIVDGDGKLSGIITNGDIGRHLHRNLGGLAVDEIMTRNPKSVRADIPAGAALAFVNQHNISALFVVDEKGCPIGVLGFHDLLRIGVA
jgi:arabinose-5-phosphate isomerase